MSQQRKGILSANREWAKHLREWGNNVFWGRERMAGKKEGERQRDDNWELEEGDWVE